MKEQTGSKTRKKTRKVRKAKAEQTEVTAKKLTLAEKQAIKLKA